VVVPDLIDLLLKNYLRRAHLEDIQSLMGQLTILPNIQCILPYEHIHLLSIEIIGLFMWDYTLAGMEWAMLQLEHL